MHLLKKFLPASRFALLAAALACLAPSAFAQKKAKVFGFYPNFDLTPMLTDAQLDFLTHVIYFSIRMPVDGQVTDTYVTSEINGQKLVDIIYRAKDHGVKVLLGVGGWQLSDEFAGVAGSSSLRKTFATTAAKFCTENGLAGMDIDWEFPTGNQANLASLLTEIKSAFSTAGLIVTLSVNGQAPEYYGSSALNKADFVLIMSYDNGTPHSTYDQATQAVQAYAGQVTQKSKLILGVPFYGKSGGATKTYDELMQMDPSLGASTNDYAGYNFNGPDLIAQKAGYIVSQGGGGTMIWQVSQDAITAKEPHGVLLAAISKGYASNGASLDKPAGVGVTPLLRARGGPALAREAGAFSLPASSLEPGSYRLTLIDPAGATVFRSLARLSAGDRRLRWAAPKPPQTALLYRVEDNARVVASGRLPAR